MKAISFFATLIMTTFLSVSAQKPVEIPLWPNGAPNTNGLTGEQEDLEGGRVANVTNPTITVYRPAKPNGTNDTHVSGWRICPLGNESRRS